MNVHLKNGLSAENDEHQNLVHCYKSTQIEKYFKYRTICYICILIYLTLFSYKKDRY